MTPASRLVPHDSTDRARCGLVSMFGMGIDALHMRCTYSGRRGGYLVYILLMDMVGDDVTTDVSHVRLGSTGLQRVQSVPVQGTRTNTQLPSMRRLSI